MARFGRELFPLDSGLRQACLEFCIRRLRRQLETLLGPFEIVIVVHCSLLPETLWSSIIGGAKVPVRFQTVTKMKNTPAEAKSGFDPMRTFGPLTGSP